MQFAMNSKLLTLIVPSYNMEPYLARCCESVVLNDTTAMDSLEVIIVNDGSTDRTGEIGHDFARRYPQTFRVVDKANGHYGSCINVGLSIASGTFVKILDADDMFDTIGLLKFLQSLVQIPSDVDLLISDFSREYQNGRIYSSNEFSLPAEESFGLNLLSSCTDLYLMHAVAYRTTLLLKMGYRQTEGICYTDNEWLIKPLRYVRKIRYMPWRVYRYLLGREGQSISLQSAINNLWMMARVSLGLAEYVSKLSWDKERAVCGFCQYLLFEMFKGSVYWLCLFGAMGHDVPKFDLRDFDRRLKDALPDVYSKLDEVVYSCRIRYRYIRAWRNRSLAFGLMRRFCVAYTKIMKLKVRFCK